MRDEANALDEVLDFTIPSNQQLYGKDSPPFDVYPGMKVRFVKEHNNDGPSFGFTIGKIYTVYNDEMDRNERPRPTYLGMDARLRAGRGEEG